MEYYINRAPSDDGKEETLNVSSLSQVRQLFVRKRRNTSIEK
jgi:hypothetical protein